MVWFSTLFELLSCSAFGAMSFFVYRFATGERRRTSPSSSTSQSCAEGDMTSSGDSPHLIDHTTRLHKQGNVASTQQRCEPRLVVERKKCSWFASEIFHIVWKDFIRNRRTPYCIDWTVGSYRWKIEVRINEKGDLVACLSSAVDAALRTHYALTLLCVADPCTHGVGNSVVIPPKWCSEEYKLLSAKDLISGPGKYLSNGKIQLRVELRVSLELNETQHVFTNNNLGILTWRLKNVVSMSPTKLESDAFVAGNGVWKLRVNLRGMQGHEFHIGAFVVSDGRYEHPVKIAIVTQCKKSSPESIHKSDTIYFKSIGTSRGWHRFIERRLIESEAHGFVEDGWFTIQACVITQQPKINASPVDDYLNPESFVQISFITEEDIKKHIATRSPFGLPLHRNQHYTLCKNESCGSLQQMINRDRATSINRSRLWFLGWSQCGLGSVGISLEELALMNVSLGDLCSPQNPVAALRFFVEKALAGHRLLAIPSNRTLLFCKHFDPAAKRMTFLRHIQIDRNMSCAALHATVCEMALVPANYAIALFLEVDSTEFIKEISQTAASIAEAGLTFGTTLILRTRQNGEMVPSLKKVKEELSAFFFANYLKQNYVSTTSDKEAPDCVVCMGKPQTSAFVHGDSCHKCVCADCAKTISRVGVKKCPICQQRIDRVIYHCYEVSLD